MLDCHVLPNLFRWFLWNLYSIFTVTGCVWWLNLNLMWKLWCLLFDRHLLLNIFRWFLWNLTVTGCTIPGQLGLVKVVLGQIILTACSAWLSQSCAWSNLQYERTYAATYFCNSNNITRNIPGQLGLVKVVLGQIILFNSCKIVGRVMFS